MANEHGTLIRTRLIRRGGRYARVNEHKVYYEDQSGWKPADFYALWRYFDRLFQYIGPTEKLQEALENPDRLSEVDRARIARVAKHQARRTGKRDAELASLDLDRMSKDTLYLMKHMLIQMGRYDQALAKFPNLRNLDGVGPLGHPLYLDDEPRYTHEYLTQVGIYL